MKAAIGNGYGFKFSDKLTLNDIYGYAYGSFMVETNEELDGLYVGEVTSDSKYVYSSEEVALSDIDALYEGKLESVYPTLEKKDNKIYESFSYEREAKAHASKHYDEVRVLIPVFPGTNCEFDSAKAMRDAGASVKIFVINNLNTKNLNKSIMDFAEEVKKGGFKYLSSAIYSNLKKGLRHLGALGAHAPAMKGMAPLCFGEGMFADQDKDATTEDATSESTENTESTKKTDTVSTYTYSDGSVTVTAFAPRSNTGQARIFSPQKKQSASQS
jgi:hypothetical protein